MNTMQVRNSVERMIIIANNADDIDFAVRLIKEEIRITTYMIEKENQDITSEVEYQIRMLKKTGMEIVGGLVLYGNKYSVCDYMDVYTDDSNLKASYNCEADTRFYQDCDASDRNELERQYAMDTTEDVCASIPAETTQYKMSNEFASILSQVTESCLYYRKYDRDSVIFAKYDELQQMIYLGDIYENREKFLSMWEEVKSMESRVFDNYVTEERAAMSLDELDVLQDDAERSTLRRHHQYDEEEEMVCKALMDTTPMNLPSCEIIMNASDNYIPNMNYVPTRQMKPYGYDYDFEDGFSRQVQFVDSLCDENNA